MWTRKFDKSVAHKEEKVGEEGWDGEGGWRRGREGGGERRG